MCAQRSANAAGSPATQARFAREEPVANPGSRESDAARSYFTTLLHDCGIERLPGDRYEHICVGCGDDCCGGARVNLRGPAADVPDELPDTTNQLVDFAVPGPRRIPTYD